MSETKKDGDPFDGMDWDRELEDWDKSTQGPGGASVPESFSSAPPPVVEPVPATRKVAADQPLPAAPPRPPTAKPLYRPPSVGLGNTKFGKEGPVPSAALPTGKPKVDAPPPSAPPPSSESRQLPSLLDDEDESDRQQGATRSGAAIARDSLEDDESDERTVIATVSKDLLAELEAAGITRKGANKPKATPPETKAAPVEVDLDGLEEETASHANPEAEDPSVVTSAPEFLAKLRKAPAGAEPAVARAPLDPSLGDPEQFDPFKHLDIEPPASQTLEPKPASRPRPEDLAGPGPQLLAPDSREHSETAETKILDRKALAPAEARAIAEEAASASAHEASDPFAAETAVFVPAGAGSDPFAAEAAMAPAEGDAQPADPFASPDPFGALAAPATIIEPPAPTDAPEVTADVREDELATGEAPSIDLLAGEESSGDAFPAYEIDQPEEAPATAASFIGDQVDAWRARADRVANDARGREKTAKARGLVVASEIAAIAGDRAKAIELAEEAWSAAPNDPLAVRQLRQLFAAEGRWDDAAPLLEAEAKAHGSPAQKAHALLLAADAARLVRSAPDEAAKHYEAAQRAVATDIRPMLARALAAVGAGKAPPLLRWPAGIGAEPLSEALTRRVKGGEPSEDLALANFVEQLPLAAEGKAAAETAVGQALEELGGSEAIGASAKWIRLGLDAARKSTRKRALERLATFGEGLAGDEARLALALDLGERTLASEAASNLFARSANVGGAATRLALDALERRTDVAALVPFADAPGAAIVARAVALAAGEDAPSVIADAGSFDAEARVARRLLAGAAVDGDLRARVSEAARAGFALADALGSGTPRVAFEALGDRASCPADAAAQPLLARMLIELADGQHDAARELAKEAADLDPAAIAAIDALLSLGHPGAESAAMAAVEVVGDDARGSIIALGVALRALRRNDGELAKQAAELALSRAGDEPLPAFVAELRARRAGDFDALIEAVRARAQANADPVARANNLVREIFLLLGSDLATCIERANEAAELVPEEPSLRALYERIAGEGAQRRAETRAKLAASMEGQAKAELLLDAAREAERHGDLEGAEKYALAAEQAGSGAEAVALRHRVQSRGDGAARLADEQLELAKRTEDVEVQREAYETLAELDLFARKDAASAILWHRAILETAPGHLPSLRRLEHMLISEGREDDYEPIASDLARVLPPDGRDAHAEVAARLRLRRPGAAWENIADLVELVAEREQPSLWATRMIEALGRHRHDDEMVLRAMDLLLARVDRPSEVATLATRAAEAAFRRNALDRARSYLERALEADPQHPTALASLAELRRQSGDDRGAAEALETLAQAQSVAEHRLEDWHSAAVLWLDRANDRVRGRAALERAAEIDFSYADVFERLVTLAREGRELEVVTDLYQRRLGQLDEVPARAAMQVDFARVLVELGDRDGARTALAAALDLVPGQLEALRLGAELAEAAGDWADVERLLREIVGLLPEGPEQSAVWRKLADLYESDLPNLQGAEEALQKVLAIDEDDDAVLARLVKIYVDLGDAEQAVETHKSRVRIATDPAARRTRFIELAKLLDEVADDPERAQKALEQARAGDPADLTALAALAEFHGKHGHPELVAPALDGALADLRRKLDERPGEPALLDHFVKILELRGRHDATKLVRAVIAALAGEPSPLIGAENAAADAALDDTLCPPELPKSMRLLLDKAGEAIEKSIPVDLRALKAAKLGANQPAMKAKIDAIAHGFGLPDPDVVIARAMPLLCLPVGSKPFQIVVGEAIIASDDEDGRRFALARTMKLCGAHVASLVRVPPAELKIYLDALLHHLVPAHPAPEIEAERLDEMTKRLSRFIPRKDEPELKQIAATLVAEGVPSIDVLAGAAATWGDRVALLAVGDLGAALRGVAWTLGQTAPPSEASAMRQWLAANPAARDLVSFALSDAYLETRARVGLPT